MVAKKASDEAIVESYKRLQNVWKVASELGICGQAVHRRLSRLGKSNKRNTWTQKKQDFLEKRYREFSTTGRLNELSKILNTPKTVLCARARRAGLTDPKMKKPFISKAVSKSSLEWHRTHEHPRGMLGKNHTEKTKARMSEASKQNWKNLSPKRKRDSKVKMLRTKTRLGNRSSLRPGTTWKAGWREIGGYKKYYRSRWEANYARYLEWLKAQGNIISWEHESEVFWFDGVRRGCVSYLPDFKVLDKMGVCYHEVKGWMDAASKTKLKRMAKYHPKVRLVLIQAKEYNEIKHKVGRIVPDWEF